MSALRLWDVSAAGRNLLDEVLSVHSNYVNSVAFGPGGRFLVSGGDQSLSISSVTAGDHTAEIRSAALSPDGNLIASGGAGNRVFVYRLSYNYSGWENVEPGLVTETGE